jgi:arylsulfatase A-like enzyme
MKSLLRLTGTALLFVQVALAAPKPNVLLIVSDDQGYADAGFQGSKVIPTPHLDRLAASGLRCTNGYVTHPFCSPTRAGLLTGRYQQRFGHENNPRYDPADAKQGLPLTEKLLPEYLRAAGYATGWVGKWHLGATPAHRPEARGFTETFGFIGGGHRFLDWTVSPKTEYLLPIERNGQPVEVTEHLTLALGREAAGFIKRHSGEPWFLYLAFNAPHSPNEPTPERLARFAGIADPKRRAYAAQMSLLDDAIGQVLAAMKDTAQEQRTLVFFFSDNGGPLEANGSINTPLREKKGTVYEGGVRVPFLVSWPGTLPAGRDYALPVSSVDVMATALAAAGAPMPKDKKYDSVNLLPHLKGEVPAAPHDRLFWRSGERLAVREGDWKLVRNAETADQLFHLANDMGETKDLATAEPATRQRLAAALDAWNAELIPPAFPGPAGRKAAKPASK